MDTRVETLQKNPSSVWARLMSHPKGFWFVFWGELAERSSFYGMRTLLALYMTSVLGFQQHEGAQIMSFFIALCYIAPLAGGWLADRVLGRYKTILYFSVPYILGHLILGGIQTRFGLFTALILLAAGSGSIKPNTSTLMGQIYEKEKKEFLLTEAFSYFYAAVNIGAALSSLGLPLVRNAYGYGVALAIPAVLMALAFILFAIGKNHYPKDEVKALPKRTPEQRRNEWMTLQRIGGIFLLISVFWLVYDQNASTWIYFSTSHTDLTLWPGMAITADQIQGLNPVLIVLLTPVFNAIWGVLRRRSGRELPDTKKMLFGFGIVTICMAIISWAGFLAATGPVSVWWILIATFVITMAELCISVVGLEFAYRQAVPGTKSVVTAAFLLTVTIGDFAGGFLNRMYETTLAPGPFFALQTGIIAVAAIIFVAVAKKFEKGAQPT